MFDSRIDNTDHETEYSNQNQPQYLVIKPNTLIHQRYSLGTYNQGNARCQVHSVSITHKEMATFSYYIPSSK